MEATYQITEDDYIKAAQLYGRPSAKTISITLIALFSLFSAAYVSDSQSLRIVFSIMLLVGFSGYFIFRNSILAYSARRQYKNYPAVKVDHRISLQEEGVHIASEDAEGLVRWDKLVKWRHNETHILIFPMPNLYYVVPKSIAAAGFDIPALIEALETHLGAEK